jgi:hypothetical protein
MQLDLKQNPGSWLGMQVTKIKQEKKYEKEIIRELEYH